MPKTRAYTREELQGLRRADLQRLCKTYDIKGANAKSDVLINLLTQHFQSSAYGGESSRRPPPRHVGRPPYPAQAAHPLPARTARSRIRSTPSSATSVSTTAGARAGTSHRPAMSRLAAGPTTAVRSTSGDQPPASPKGARPARLLKQAKESSELEKLTAEVQELRDTVKRLEEQQSIMIMALLDRDDVQRKLRAIIAAEMASSRSYSLAPDFKVAETATETASEPQSTGRCDSRAGGLGPEVSASPLLPCKRKNNALEAAATTTKKTRHESPEVRGTSPSSNPATPSNGHFRPVHDSGPSKVSAKKHRVDGAISSSDHSVETPSMAVEQGTLHATPVPLTPATLNSSIAATTRPEEQTSTTRTPLRMSGHSNREKPLQKASDPGPHLQSPRHDKSDSQRDTQSAQKFNIGRSSEGKLEPIFDYASPAREYMDVALNGLASHCKAASDLPGPSLRTLLGTERYRDTRFGDEPIVPWGTPATVDFGPPTPVRDGVL